MENSVSLATNKIIPLEGYFRPNGNIITAQFFCADMDGASVSFAIEGSLSPENANRWDALQESGEDIAITVASGVCAVQSFAVDSDLAIRFRTTSASGTVDYVII